MGGIHIIGDFEDCQGNAKFLGDEKMMQDFIEQIVDESGLTRINSDFQSVGPEFGYTGYVTLLESHVSIHTWPEHNFANLDVFTCNYNSDNVKKTQYIYNKLKELLVPNEHNLKIIGRKGASYNDALDRRTWGYHLLINMYGCDDSIIKDEIAIKGFVIKLCELIDMKRYGPCECVDFGEDIRVSGYSMFQLIETSNISAHFVNLNGNVYLDIFSCKPYDITNAIEFSTNYFCAKDYMYNYLER